VNKFHLSTAAEVLHRGGVIAYPTESVFGLGCDPQNESAILQILSLKRRSIKRGLILIAASFEQLSPYIASLDDQLSAKTSETWPGPTTWLLPAGESSSIFLRGKHDLQAVRVSNHPLVQNLCNKFGGAIVSTSANVTSRPAAKTAIQVLRQFPHGIDYVINSPVGGLKTPCEIRHGLNDKLIRAGTR